MDDIIKKHLSDVLIAIEEIEDFLGGMDLNCLMIFSVIYVLGVLLNGILRLLEKP